MIRLVVPVITVAVLMPMPAQAFLSRLSRARQQAAPLARQAQNTIINRPVVLRPPVQRPMTTQAPGTEVPPSSIPWYRRALPSWAAGTTLGAVGGAGAMWHYNQEAQTNLNRTFQKQKKQLSEEVEQLKKTQTALSNKLDAQSLTDMLTLLRRFNPQITDAEAREILKKIKLLGQLEISLDNIFTQSITTKNQLQQLLPVLKGQLAHLTYVINNIVIPTGPAARQAEYTSTLNKIKRLREIIDVLSSAKIIEYPGLAAATTRDMDDNIKYLEEASTLASEILKNERLMTAQPSIVITPAVITPASWTRPAKIVEPEKTATSREIIEALLNSIDNIREKLTQKPLPPTKRKEVEQAVKLASVITDELNELQLK